MTGYFPVHNVCVICHGQGLNPDRTHGSPTHYHKKTQTSYNYTMKRIKNYIMDKNTCALEFRAH